MIHGDYEVRAFSDRSFYVVRNFRTYDTFVLLFNVADTADIINLTRIQDIKVPSTVEVASIHSSRRAG